jgi:hypothetical protein
LLAVVLLLGAAALPGLGQGADGGMIEQIASYPLQARGGLVIGDRAYLLADEGSPAQRGLLILNVADPTRPSRLGYLAIADARELAVSGQHAYVTGRTPTSWTQLVIVDVADPTRPVQVGTYQDSIGATSIAAAGQYAYLGGRGWTTGTTGPAVRVLDVADPTSPKLVDTVSIVPFDLAAAGARLYVNGTEPFGATSGLRVYDLADPVHPRLLGVVPGVYGPPTIDGTRVYVVSREYGPHGLRRDRLLSLDLADPTRPIVVGQYVIPEPAPGEHGVLGGPALGDGIAWVTSAYYVSLERGAPLLRSFGVHVLDLDGGACFTELARRSSVGVLEAAGLDAFGLSESDGWQVFRFTPAADGAALPPPGAHRYRLPYVGQSSC